MPLTLGEQPVPSSPLAAKDRSSDPSSGTGKTIVMLVTNEGLSDPRVLRSVQAALRAKFVVHLVCRALPKEKENEIVLPGTEVHRVASLYGRRLLKKLFSRRQKDLAVSGSQDQAMPLGTAVSRVPRVPGMSLVRRLLARRKRDSDDRPSFWLRPWELWILGGITWFNLQAVRQMWRLPAALYHANDLDALPAGVILSRWNRVPLLYDAHELFSAQFSGSSRQFRGILFWLEHWLIRSAHKVVTVNHSIAETLAEWHRVPLPTVVMNCPFAVEAVRPKPSSFGEVRVGKARVIFQGVYVRDRGLEELILSAVWYDSAELYLRGYGELEPSLRAIVQEMGLEGRVHFLAPAHPARLVESLAGFDVGVVPYRPTTLNNRLCLPNKVFEYLQAGLALAVSTLPELRLLMNVTGAGELFDPDSPEDIARAINALTCDAGRLQALKARARAAGARFTWEAQGEPQLLACYRELVGLFSRERGGLR